MKDSIQISILANIIIILAEVNVDKVLQQLPHNNGQIWTSIIVESYTWTFVLLKLYIC